MRPGLVDALGGHPPRDVRLDAVCGNLVVEHTRRIVRADGGRERHDDLPLLLRLLRRSLRRHPLALLDDELRPVGELRGGRVRHAGLERELALAALRTQHGHDPVVPELLLVDEVVPLEDHSVAPDAHHHSLRAPAHLPHARAEAEFARAVLAPGRQAEPPQRRSANRRKRTLPYAALVRKRIVRVAGERDGVRIVGQHLVRRPAVPLVPGPGAVAGVLRVGVLREEERTARRELRAVGGEKHPEVLLPVPFRPVRPDERIALHRLDEERTPLLAEKLPPVLLHVAVEPVGISRVVQFALLLRLVVVDLLVVAGHKHLLRRVGVFPEYVVPGGGYHPHLRHGAAVRKVARDQHGVDALLPEEPQNVAEHVYRALALVLLWLTQVDVAQYADLEVGSAKRIPGERGRAGTRRKRPYEASSCRHFPVPPTSTFQLPNQQHGPRSVLLAFVCADVESAAVYARVAGEILRAD